MCDRSRLCRLIVSALSCLFAVGLAGSAVAGSSSYEENIQRPTCDGSKSHVKIVDEPNDWSAVNDSQYRVFCVRPGDYTGLGDITLSADGQKNQRRYLIYSAPNGSNPAHTHPVDAGDAQRATIRGLQFDDADWWVVQGLFIDGGDRLQPTGDGISFLDDSSDNVVDRSVVQHGSGTLVQIEHGSSNNTVQNSVVRETDSDASRPSKDYHCFHIKGDKPGTRNNHIVRNEIYDCAGDSIHFSGCPYWLPDAHQRDYDCAWKGNKNQRFAGDTRGTVIRGNDMYVTSDMKNVCGGSCGCYENAIDMKSTMGSTDRSTIGSEDWVRIERNRIWDECDGDLSAIIAHFANTDYVLLRHNVVFNVGYAYRPVKKDDPFVDHHSVIGNVFASVENMTSVSKIAKDIEFYNNVVVDVPDRVLAGYGDSGHFDLQCNAFIDGGTWPIPESRVQSDYNDFYNTSSFGSGSHNQSHGSAADAKMEKLCFERKIWTSGTQHCLAGAKTTAMSPHHGRCPSSIGGYGNVGVHDKQDKTFFRPYVEARQLTVTAKADPASGAAPLTVQFKASATHASGNVQFDWQFGDGDSASGANPAHTYAAAGDYEVEVTATDDDGATDTATLEVTVEGPKTTRFSSVPYYGDFTNWEPKTPDRWAVTDVDGDPRLFLATSDYSADDNQPGEFALVRDRQYDEWTLSFTYRTAETLADNDFADIVALFGWRDADNYYFLTAHRQDQYAKLFAIEDGTRRLVAELEQSFLPDEDWHRLTVEYDGTDVRVALDGERVLKQSLPEDATGRVGLGSFDESAYFDDVTVETPGGADAGDTGTADTGTADVGTADTGTADTGGLTTSDVGPSDDTTLDAGDAGGTPPPPGGCSGCRTAVPTAPYPNAAWLLLFLVAGAMFRRQRESRTDILSRWFD